MVRKSPSQLDREIAEALRTRAPSDWADWPRAVQRLRAQYGRDGFVKWAEAAPRDPAEDRYAVIVDGGLTRWARVSPVPTLPIEVSPGAFYSDMPGGARAAAARAAKAYKKKMKALASES